MTSRSPQHINRIESLRPRLVQKRRQIPFTRSLSVAIRGIGEAVAEQRNLKIHLVVTVLVLATAALLRVTLLQWALIVMCIGVVIATELLNTAIETVVDRISPEDHELSRKAKDISAGAVLTVTIMAVIVGLLIFGERLWSRTGTLPEKPAPRVESTHITNSAG
jgi:Diacylglycerol kinase